MKTRLLLLVVFVGALQKHEGAGKVLEAQDEPSFIELAATPGRLKANQFCVACQFLIQRTTADYHEISMSMGRMDPPESSTGFPMDWRTIEILNSQRAATTAVDPLALGVASAGANDSASKVTVEIPVSDAPTVKTVKSTTELKEGEKPPVVTTTTTFLSINHAARTAPSDSTVFVSLQERTEPAKLPPRKPQTMPYHPKKERAQALLINRPSWERYSNILLPGSLDARNLIARNQFNFLTQIAYKHFADDCVRKVPQVFENMCTTMAGEFKEIADGIYFRDRPDQTCMKLGYCPKDSYIQQGKKHPHAVAKLNSDTGGGGFSIKIG